MARVLAKPQAHTPDVGARYGRPDIAGLCAVAVLLVVGNAARLGLSGGYVGVDVLLVISGYLLTRRLLREDDDQHRISSAGFAARGALRVLTVAPAVVVAAIAASAVVLESPPQLNSVAHDGLWAAVLGANFHFASTGAHPFDPSSPASPLQHYWALSVGAQLSLVWLVVLLLGRKLAGRRWIVGIAAALVAASLAWSIRETTTHPNAAFFSTFTRAWEFGAGGLLALAAPALARLTRTAAAVLGWAGIGLVAFAAVGFDAGTSFPGWAAAVPVMGALAVIAAGGRGPGALLGIRPLVAIGACSFAFYLVHWPVLTIAEAKHPGLDLLPRLLLVAFAAGLAVASYRLLELPVRRSVGRTRSPARALAVGVGCTAVALLYAGMTVVAQDSVARNTRVLFDAEQRAANATAVVPLATADQISQAVTAATTLSVLRGDVTPPVGLAHRDVSLAHQDGCLVDLGTVESPPCRYGDVESAATVALFGDEQAAQWLPALLDLADRQSFGVVVLAKASCPVSEVASSDECLQWRRSALERIAALRPMVVVASEGTPPAADEAGLRTTLDRLSRSAARVVLLSETPVHTMGVPECLIVRSRDIATCGISPTQALHAARTGARRATAQAAGARFVDVHAWLCTATACPPVIDGRITMVDSSHLTSTYASYLSHVLGVETGMEPASQTTAFTGQATDAQVRMAVAAALEGRQPSAGLRSPPNIAVTETSPAFANGCLLRREKATSPDCEFGDLRSSKNVVLLGDSRAAQWMPALVGGALRNGFKLTVLTKGACPAPTMTVYIPTFNRPFIECDLWREHALRRIDELRPDLVVMSSSFHAVQVPGGQPEDAAAEDAWARGLVTTVDRLQSSGARVVYVGDVPAHVQRVPDCIQAQEESPLSCATPAPQAILVAHRDLETKVVTQQTTAGYVDAAPWFCTEVACPAVINSTITAFDDTHLTATYSAYLSHAFVAAVGLEP